MESRKAKLIEVLVCAVSMVLILFVVVLGIHHNHERARAAQTTSHSESKGIPTAANDKVTCIDPRVVDDKLDKENELGLLTGMPEPVLFPSVEFYDSTPQVLDYHRDRKIFYYKETIFVKSGKSDWHALKNTVVAGFVASDPYATACGQAVRVRLVLPSETENIKEILVRQIGKDVAGRVQFWGLNGGW